MPIKSAATKAILSQQIQITLIRTFLIFAIVFAAKSHAEYQNDTTTSDLNSYSSIYISRPQHNS
ncbi:MAG: hypothetical protein HFP81_09200 [Methylococcales symbiont of Hymedesmia sp. n. MRB-2018]|nr:MAG: hypothetical protein HFP81_09200 [Methylococcales symbiont of Hymedesmia sp. n. MRB-2018]